MRWIEWLEPFAGRARSGGVDVLGLPAAIGLVLMLATGPVLAGRYPASGTQTFPYTAGTTNLGDGTAMASAPGGIAAIESNSLRLTLAGTQNTKSSFKIPDLDPGKELESWDATFTVRMNRDSQNRTPADGWSLNVGPIPSGNGDGEGGFVMANGLVIAFDTYNNGNDPPSIEVFANGISVGNFTQSFSFDTVFRSLAVHWDSAGLDITYNGQSVCANLLTPGYVPASGHRFAFSGRTGGSTQGAYIDDLVIATVAPTPLQTGGPVISEFCADNRAGVEDENGDTSDWIEIYNGSATPVNLAGYTLTDLVANPGMWTLPSVTIPAYGYLRVFASSKNRVDPAYPLHTNFSLAKEGGYLALFKPGGLLANEFNYGVQVADGSYGLLGSGGLVTWGYLETPTPGSRNVGLQAAGPPAEDVVYLRDGVPTTGGLFSSSFQLVIQAPLEPGSVVRYTTNNTPPSETSPVYGAPLSISSTTTVRARVYTPGRLPGPIASRTFLQLDASLTDYHGSGQPFSSNLPIIVLDSFGVPVDQYTTEGSRPFRLCYALTIDKNPSAPAPDTDRAVITATPDFQGRCGTHVRGESSATFEQRSYAWELWNNENEDKDASILGFPAESDWVLHAPWTDKCLMRNYIAYDLMRKWNGNSSAMGVKFVEVFFNQDGGTLSESDYRGVYVLIEKIKRDADRVNIEKLGELVTDASMIGGGYLFRKDKPDPEVVSFSTSTYGQQFQFVEPTVPNATQQAWLTSHMNSFEAALAGAGFANPATGYAAYIEPRSFIDNQWWVEIAKQIDGYRFSTYFFKDRNGKITAAPVWDYNLSFYNANYNGGDIHSGWYYSLLGAADYYYWPRLHQDVNYRIRHWDRYWELRRGMFESNTILGYIDGLANQLVNGSSVPVVNSMSNLVPLAENPAMRHFRKWPKLGTYLWPNPGTIQGQVSPNYRTKYWNGPSMNPVFYGSADAEVDAMKSFLKMRLEWIDDQNFTGTTIYRPPVFGVAPGSVEAGTLLTISRYSGTAPSGYGYASGGTLYYTLDGTDPRSSSGVPVGSPYSVPLVLNDSLTVRARLYDGVNWSPVTTATYLVNARPASAANLVISEICYKPLAPAPGTPEYLAGFTSSNNFEYVEILNVSDGDINLAGCSFTQGITFDFDTVDPSKLILGPGERVLLVGNLQAFLMRHGSGLAEKVLGVFDGNLSNSGEAVTLLAADDSVIASVTYGIAEPWPVEPQSSGHTLLLDAVGPHPTYDAAAFLPSAQAGGTPGASSGPVFGGNPVLDSDGDGFTDFLEHATGSAAGDAASVHRPVAGVLTVTESEGEKDYLTLSFRRANAVDDVVYVVEFATDPGGAWTSGPGAVDWVGSTKHGDGTSTVTWRAAAPISNDIRQFLRLRVTKP